MSQPVHPHVKRLLEASETCGGSCGNPDDLSANALAPRVNASTREVSGNALATLGAMLHRLATQRSEEILGYRGRDPLSTRSTRQRDRATSGRSGRSGDKRGGGRIDSQHGHNGRFADRPWRALDNESMTGRARQRGSAAPTRPWDNLLRQGSAKAGFLSFFSSFSRF